MIDWQHSSDMGESRDLIGLGVWTELGWFLVERAGMGSHGYVADYFLVRIWRF